MPLFFVLGLALAFVAGYKFREGRKMARLPVLYMGDEGLAVASAEEQVLALIYAEPSEDALVSFLAKDFRKASSTGMWGRDRGAEEEFKVVPLGTDYVRNFGQSQVNGLVARYVEAYNKSLADLIKGAAGGVSRAAVKEGGADGLKTGN
ncbi:hypothetical protein [Prosthecobacter sp.]|uniref:hypothetical protein n=1 Tax=Prosthecobacter sp. TaxID=1965333 RepID=UPI0037841E1D